eukprot:6457111-Amphidinium_carterae.2
MPQLEAQAGCTWYSRSGALWHPAGCPQSPRTGLLQVLAHAQTQCHPQPYPELDTQTSTKRGLERADLHLVLPEGVGVYIDLRITTVPYLADVANHLAEQERQKRQQYVRAAVKPVIISTLAHLAMDAHALLSPITSLHARSALRADTTWAALLANARRAGPLFQPLSVLLLSNAATVESSCTGQARLTADMQNNVRHNLDAQGKVAPTIASSRAQQHALTSPDEPITASHAALHQATALDSPSTSAQPADSSQHHRVGSCI